MSLISKQWEQEQRERINGVSVIAHSVFAATIICFLPWLYTKDATFLLVTLVFAISCVIAYWSAYRVDKRSQIQGRWGNIAKMWSVMAMTLTMYILRGLPEETETSTVQTLWIFAGGIAFIAIIAGIAEASIPDPKLSATNEDQKA